MISKLLIVSSIFISINTFGVTSLQTSNISCKLKKNETLTIGCTNYCGRFNRWALRRYARKLGYKLRVVNLRSQRQTIDYTQVDGILIPGGSDIDPKWYIPKVEPELQQYLNSIKHYTKYTNIGRIRDEFEFGLLEKYFKDKEARYQPILGICRGMQVLTVSQGIPLYIDLKKELGIKNRKYTLDKIKVTNEESLIQEVIGRTRFRAVELHHQGLRLDYFLENKERWPHLEVTTISNRDKIAESLEFYNRPILGVQFHPEYTFGKVRRGIFKWLLKRSCFNKVMKNKIKGNL